MSNLLRLVACLFLCVSLNSFGIDSDNDGLPDDWEIKNNKNPYFPDYQIESWGGFACALDDEGIKCWGEYASPLPEFVNPRQVSVGYYHACALDDVGVKCWLTRTTSSTDDEFMSRLIDVPNLVQPSFIDIGNVETCALDSEGVKCWGNNDIHNVLSVPPLSNPTRISVGNIHACALDDSGMVCWGGEPSGWTPPPLLINPRQINSGGYKTCALDDEGVKCWGRTYASYGSLNVPELLDPKGVFPGTAQNACAIDGTDVICWGRRTQEPEVWPQFQLPELDNPVFICEGFDCAITRKGIVTWGDGAVNTLMPPLSVDPDNDGFSSQDGVDSFPLDARYWEDTDKDGLPNQWESFFNLDPNDANDANSSYSESSGITALSAFMAGSPSIIDGDISKSIDQGESTIGILTAIDIDGLTDGSYFSISTPPAHGQAVINASSGFWVYLGNPTFAGIDPFTVTVTDDLGGTTEQIINIIVVGTDTDGDTIYDPSDNCPNTANTNQSDIDNDQLGDACDSDIDGDGVDNTLDAFPNDSTESSDSDSDNVGDNTDNCLNTANFDQSDIDSDTLGDACDSDMDGDGIANVVELRFGGDETDNTDASVSQNNIVTFSETAPADSDLDGVPDDVEAMLGEDNTSSTFQDLLDTLSTIVTAKNVPAMGGIGLLALGLSMLGLGAVRLRKR